MATPDVLVDPVSVMDSTRDIPMVDPMASLARAASQEFPGSNLPPPNPPFVFPARPPSAPSSSSGTPGRRPQSAIETNDRPFITDGHELLPSRSPALPAFSFNPGANLKPESSMLSPPLSPPPGSQSPRAIPSRPGGHGHRRGGSEFVGGSIRGGDAIAVMSTSPTKSESGFASPTLPPPRPSGRRGHAHRRSAAISSHDLSAIMNPPTSNSNPKGTSPPPSPADLDRQSPTLEPFPAAPVPTPIKVELTTQASENERRLGAVQEPKPTSRARVGFSDTLEYIPRPLSLVSSDASSTATARPGHSLSGSISSIVSATASQPLEPETEVPLSQSISRPRSDSRPSTAGAILERTESTIEQIPASPRRRNSIPILSSIPDPAPDSSSSPSPTKTPKRWSFFGLEPFIGTASPKCSRPGSASSSQSGSHRGSAANSSSEHVPEPVLVEPHKKTPKTKKHKKQKKVKAWAGSILTRRTKARHLKSKTGSRRSQTPPTHLQVRGVEAAETSPAPLSAPMAPLLFVTESDDAEDSEPAKPRPASADDESAYPVIDLDAALGPFNTPLPYNPEWEAAQRAGAPSKRKLHSAAGMSHFSGPGMHYHRRAESAPEMAPFEHARFGIHRFGSSSTMADVFEEDEEDEDAATRSKQSSPSSSTDEISEEAQAANIDIRVIDAEQKQTVVEAQSTPEESPKTTTKCEASSSLDNDTPSIKSQPSAQSLANSVTLPQLPLSMPPGPDSSPVAPTEVEYYCDSAEPSPRRVPRKDLAPVDVALQLPSSSLAPASPFSMTHSSAFPSPRSPISYETNRMSTAPSSIADENTFQSLLMGEPGPEVRYSVDDIPSLTSSNSTMTKDSSFAPHPRSSHGNLSGQRPVSFSSMAFSRRRSSLASLSRFISSSHGERSKLSVEVSCDSEPEKKQKTSKAKRLSRMMQFWKSAKESSSS